VRFGICCRSWGEFGGIGVYTRSIIPSLLSIDHNNEYFVFFQKKDDLGKLSQFKNAHEIYIPSKSKLIWDQVKTPWFASKFGVDVILHTKLTIPFFTTKKTVMVLHGTERFFYTRVSFFQIASVPGRMSSKSLAWILQGSKLSIWREIPILG
jgi:hypothetical protein